MGPILEGLSRHRARAMRTKARNEKPTAIRADGTRKAKARIVVLGFQHPDLCDPECRTASPVMATHSRAMLLQLAAFRRFKLESCDASSAFLQTAPTEEPKRIWTTGVPELAIALGVEPGEALRILRACYGLTTAPRAFWKDVKTRLEDELGGLPIVGDQCIWIFINSSGDVMGACGSHVDDFILCGDHNGPEWLKKREEIRNL